MFGVMLLLEACTIIITTTKFYIPLHMVALATFVTYTYTLCVNGDGYPPSYQGTSMNFPMET